MANNKVNDVLKALNSWAPPQLQEGYDNATIISGNLYQEVSNVLVSLDCIESILDEAIEKNCNCIVSHHPIVFKGLKSFTGKNYVERTIIKAIKNDIAIIAVHTNLDNVWHGVNNKIGEMLGLRNLKVLATKENTLQKLFTYVPQKNAETLRNSLFEAGAGKIGNYDSCSFNSAGIGTFKPTEGANPYVGKVGEIHHENEQKIEVVFPTYLRNKIIEALRKNHPYEEVAFDIFDVVNHHPQIGAGMIGEIDSIDEQFFLEKVKSIFKCGVIKHTNLLNKPITKVAYCGGAGSFLLSKAINHNADIFITGDVKYHEFFDADGKIVFADIGHFESEQFTIDLIGDFLKQNFNTFATHLTGVKTNPVNYF